MICHSGGDYEELSHRGGNDRDEEAAVAALLAAALCVILYTRSLDRNLDWAEASESNPSVDPSRAARGTAALLPAMRGGALGPDADRGEAPPLLHLQNAAASPVLSVNHYEVDQGAAVEAGSLPSVPVAPTVTTTAVDVTLAPDTLPPASSAGGIAAADTPVIVVQAFPDSRDSISWKGELLSSADAKCITPPPFGKQCTMHEVRDEKDES